MQAGSPVPETVRECCHYVAQDKNNNGKEAAYRINRSWAICYPGIANR